MKDLIDESEYLMSKAIDLANDIQSTGEGADWKVVKSLSERAGKLAKGCGELSTEIPKRLK